MSLYHRVRSRRDLPCDPPPPAPRPWGTEGWRVVAGMATHAPRAGTAAKPIRWIANQVDELHVHCNGMVVVPPELPRLPNVRYYADGSDNGAGAKLRYLGDPTIDVAFGVDDDLLYPPDYVSHSLACLLWDPTSTFCYHGVRLEAPYATYRKNRKVWNGLLGLSEPQLCHVLGTGTAFWSPRDALGGGPREADTPWPVRIDTPCGHAVLSRGGRIVCPPRRDPWIRAHGPAGKYCSITAMTTRDASPIDTYVLSHGVHLIPLLPAEAWP
jgi:hypothetical protein